MSKMGADTPIHGVAKGLHSTWLWSIRLLLMYIKSLNGTLVLAKQSSPRPAGGDGPKPGWFQRR